MSAEVPTTINRASLLLSASVGVAPGADCAASAAYALLSLPLSCTISGCGPVSCGDSERQSRRGSTLGGLLSSQLLLEERASTCACTPSTGLTDTALANGKM